MKFIQKTRGRSLLPIVVMVFLSLSFFFVVSAHYSKLYAGDCCAQCPDYCECVAECGGSCIKTKQCGMSLPDCRGVGTNCCICDEGLPG